MTSFQKLVEDRSTTAPQDFFERSTPAADRSLLAPGRPHQARGQTETATPSTSQEQSPSTQSPENIAAKQPPAANQMPKSTNFPAKRGQGAKGGSYNQDRQKKDRAALDALKMKVDIIQLSLVMSLLGAQGNQDNDKTKWKIPGIGNITVTGQKWYNLESEEGGIGAVGLVMHAKSLKYPLAIKWLGEAFGESVDSDDIKASADSMAFKEKKHFDPPPKVDKNISFVKHYLKFSRKIPDNIIDSLVSQGRIYADEARTCVFSSEGIAELRSSFDGPGSVKKLVTGSTRKKGFLVLPDEKLNERTLAICESAIDAMSYRALYPGRAAISSAGANRAFPRSIAEEALGAGFKVIAAFDADKAGDKASQSLFNHFYLKLWLKHKSSMELGKELDDDTLFNLLDNKVVTFQLATSANESEENESFEAAIEHANENTEGSSEILEMRNILFFNKSNPFEDPAAPPTILVSIRKNEHGLPECLNFPLEVSPKGYEFVVQKLGVARDRPRGEKDWNELLKKSSNQAAPLDSKALSNRP